MKVSVVTERHDFEALSGEWSELLADSDTDCLFLTWEWLFSWWREVARERSLHVVTVRRGDRLVGIAPLVARGARLRGLQPFRLLEFLGSGAAGSDYLDIIIRRGDERGVLDALADHFRTRGQAVEFGQAREPSPRIDGLAARLGADGWGASRQTVEVCPYIDLTGHDWTSYLESLGSSHRYNVRRRFRKLHREFAVEFQQADSEQVRGDAFGALVDLHHLRRDELDGSDGLHTESLVRFHEAFSALALQRGWLRLYLMKLDGRPAAALYGFAYGRKFYFYQSGFDPALGRYSVGLVLLAHTIRCAIDEGAVEYDLLHGDEDYKYRWTAIERDLCRVNLYPPDARGKLSLRLMQLKQRIKRTLRTEARRPCRAA